MKTRHAVRKKHTRPTEMKNTEKEETFTMAGDTRAVHKRKQHPDSKNNETVLIDSAKSAEKTDDEKIISTQITASPDRKVGPPGDNSGSPGATPEWILAIKAVPGETNQTAENREAGTSRPSSPMTDEVAGTLQTSSDSPDTATESKRRRDDLILE